MDSTLPIPGGRLSEFFGGLRRFPQSRFFYRFRKNRLALAGLAVTLLFLALAAVAWFLPEHLGNTVTDDVNFSPSAAHWFGADDLGRDIFWRIVRGSTYTIGAGFSVIFLAVLTGVPLGLLAGYVGGRIDSIIMRAMDIVLAFPSLLLALALIAALGASLRNAIVAIAVVFMPRFARVLRASTLQVREMEYVAASRSMGCRPLRTLVYHVFPNTVSPLLVLATISLSSAILEVAALSFLGMGDPKLPEWGAMLNDAREVFSVNPSLMLYPGIALSIVVFAINVFGDGLRDAFDVRLD